MGGKNVDKKMKAQVFHEKEKMELKEVSLPEINEDEVLIKVKVCGICGSDVSYYFGESPVETPTGKGPIILGHEISGKVVEVGSIAKKAELFCEGDRVLVNPAQQCNTCTDCAQGHFNLCKNIRTAGVSYNGGFAEYVKVRYTHLFKIPENLSFEEAALVEPLACSTYGVQNLDVQIGNSVVIFGDGLVGLMMLQLIKSKGAEVTLVGTSDYSLKKAGRLGADHIFNIRDENSKNHVINLKASIKEVNNNKLADRVIVATSALSAMEQALKISGGRSTVVYFGLPGEEDELKVPVLDTITKDKTLRFSWLAPLTWPTAIKAIDTGKVKVKELITHRYNLQEVEKGLKFMASKDPKKIKGVVKLI